MRSRISTAISSTATTSSSETTSYPETQIRGPILNLDIWYEIARYLLPHDLLRLSSCSHWFRSLLLWGQICNLVLNNGQLRVVKYIDSFVLNSKYVTYLLALERVLLGEHVEGLEIFVKDAT